MIANRERTDYLLDQLNGSGSDNEFRAIEELRTLGEELPKFLLVKYRDSKKWQTRSSCVYHAIRYSRDVYDAFELGVEALADRSKVVRYRACMLLAYSLRDEALPHLRKLADNSKDIASAQDALAAIDAISHKNHNYFVDRDHSGKMTLTVR